MSDSNAQERRDQPLGVDDVAPDFELPAADVDGTVARAEFRGRGPVLLLLLRGLYCPFCRRNISLLRPTCEALRAAGVGLVGVVIVRPERARQYFRSFPPCFPMAAAPDRSLHRAYGLDAITPTAELLQEVESRAADVLRDRSGADEVPVPASRRGCRRMVDHSIT